ncbi:hypothetical protein [Cupriavidus sp. IK-TO18]|uniref:hypothetical protein n=1 Tax=unclassified Cupriavidus TaxID=2640874 RepID=UPI0034CFE95B
MDALADGSGGRQRGCTDRGDAHDACASRDLEFEGVEVPAAQAHAAFMAALRFAYARVISTREWLDEQHPR